MAQLKKILLVVSILCFVPALADAAPPKIANPVNDLLIKRNYKGAFETARSMAAAGNVKAMLQLANAYRLGLGTPRDTDQAIKTYQTAASAGSAEARKILARMHVSIPATAKKAAEAGSGGISGTIDYAHLPARAKDQPDWPVIAAAHQDKEALRALLPQATTQTLATSARIGDVVGVALLANAKLGESDDPLGHTALMLAAKSKNPEVLNAVLQGSNDLSKLSNAKQSALGLAASQCQPQAMSQLIKAGASFEVKSEASPPLVIAAQHCPEWAELKPLFEKQNMNVQDERGRTASWYAASQGNEPLLHWLADQGADLNLADKDGYAPLHSAAMNGQVQTLKFILEKVPTADAVTARGTTPLMLAAYAGCKDCVTALAAHKADFDKKDEIGETSLMYAVRGLQGTLAQSMVESGANANAKNNAGDTPMKLGTRIGLVQGIEAP